MNYDLAMMALDGMARAPMNVYVENNGAVVIEGSAASFKELARLCLLMGGGGGEAGETIELASGVHLQRDAKPVRLQLS